MNAGALGVAAIAGVAVFLLLIAAAEAVWPGRIFD